MLQFGRSVELSYSTYRKVLSWLGSVPGLLSWGRLARRSGVRHPVFIRWHRFMALVTLTIDHTTTALLDNPPGDMRNAMGMNIRLLCRLINAVCDHIHATHHDQGATR